MRLLRLSWLITGIWCGLSVQQDAFSQGRNGVWWIYPPYNGLTFNELDVVNVSYRSTFSNPNLYTFCNDNGGSATSQKRMQPAMPNDGWVLVNLNFTNEEGCWFNLRPGTEGGANGPRFTIRAEPRSILTTLSADVTTATATVTSASSSSTSTSTSTSSASSSSSTSGTGATGEAANTSFASATSTVASSLPVASSAAADTGAATESLSSELTAGAKAGIGIGAAVGGIALLALIFFLRRRSSRRRASEGSDPIQKGSNELPIEKPMMELEGQQEQQQYQHQQPQHYQHQQHPQYQNPQHQHEYVQNYHEMYEPKHEIDGWAVSPPIELAQDSSPHYYAAELPGGQPTNKHQPMDRKL